MQRIAVLTALAAAGIAWMMYEDHQKPLREERIHARAEERARNLASAQIKSRSMPYKNGSITELKIPTDPNGIGIIEYQTCFVLETGPQASPAMSCPGEKFTEFAE